MYNIVGKYRTVCNNDGEHNVNELLRHGTLLRWLIARDVYVVAALRRNIFLENACRSLTSRVCNDDNKYGTK